jgi:hypothetical protein
VVRVYCDNCKDEITEQKDNDGHRKTFKLGKLLIQTIPAHGGDDDGDYCWNKPAICLKCVRKCVAQGKAYAEDDTAMYPKSGKSRRLAAGEKA